MKEMLKINIGGKTCRVVDQAALHRLLKKVRDLGTPLLSVDPMESDQGDGLDDKR